MIQINHHFLELQADYLFSEIAKRVAQHQPKGGHLINLGIGDTVLPLPPAVTTAFQNAVEEMGRRKSFRGYGPQQGYSFLRECIAEHEYQARNITIQPDEVFISDGAKCDAANIQELFADQSSVAISDPVYPVYRDSNIIAGRGRELNYLKSTVDNHFIAPPPSTRYDLIYLCYPNNPTGVMCTSADLARWVSYALEHKSILIYDAAYERFIRDPKLPHSIYEIPHAKRVAIEIRSFSKNASFTGTRCAFTVVPKECVAYDEDKREVILHTLWMRRCATKFNGVSYPVQRAAAAIYSPTGKQQVDESVDYYLQNAAIIRQALTRRAIRHWGGEHAPYIWVDTGGSGSWELFDRLLQKYSLITTPGAGFGSCGEGYIRISAFNVREEIERAAEKLVEAL